MKISEKDRSAIEKTIHTCIGWALTKDLDSLYAALAQDDEFFIFHPDSRSTIHGFEAFKRFGEKVWLNDAFKATDYSIKELRVNLAECGQAAWFSCFLDDHSEWNGRPMGWDNCRWTGTLEKRDDRWVVVQMHFSFPKDE